MNISKLEQAWSLRRENPDESYTLVEEIIQDSQITQKLSDYYDALTVKSILDIYKSNYKIAEKESLETYDYYKINPSPVFACRNANNLGMLYIIYGDFSKAISYLSNGLDYSKKNHVDEMSIFMLYNLAEIYKDIENFDKAILFLTEAIELNLNEEHLLSNVLYSSIAMCFQETGQPDEALIYSQKSIELSEYKKDMYSLGLCYIVIAQIRLMEKKYDEAKIFAEKSLNARLEIKDDFAIAVSYCRLAEIVLAQGFSNQSIDYAFKALKLVTELNSHAINPALYKVLCDAHKSIGLTDEALKYSELHCQTEKIIHDERLQKSISILSAEKSIESIKKYAEIYRLNNIELKKKSEELLLISKVGKALINALNIDQLLFDIYHNISVMINAPLLLVGLLNEDNFLEYKWILFNNERLEPHVVINDKHSLGYQAINGNRSIYIPHFNFSTYETERVGNDKQFDNISSVLFCPLYNKQRAIGVISLQSERENAYSKDDIVLMEGLSSYIAIAIENANKAEIISNTANKLQLTLNHLEETQEQLIKAEKLAGLGQLVAGVAHELNTPIGVSITMITHQLFSLEKLKSDFMKGKLKKQTLKDYIEESTNILSEVEKAILHSSEMIQSFKSLALTDYSFKIKTFTINELLTYISNEQRQKLNETHIKLITNTNYDIVSTYPRILNDIVSHFISNSINHSFINKENPIIQLSIKIEESNLVIQYKDNGIPIPLEVQSKMFDPFFSTKKIDGLMGIGLHAVHNMVTQVLKGTIEYDNGFIIKTKI
ncbi:MAG: tetratricopeptide repeat protein [Clostridiales bacterium]|nr:tetratricopeptide repeat protein [Clostridiales bacterium]